MPIPTYLLDRRALARSRRLLHDGRSQLSRLLDLLLVWVLEIWIPWWREMREVRWIGSARVEVQYRLISKSHIVRGCIYDWS